MAAIVTQQSTKGPQWRLYAIKGLVLLAIIGVLSQMITVVDTFSLSEAGSTSFRGGATFTDDAQVIVTPGGIHKIGQTKTGSGDTAPGVEPTGALAPVNNALVQNHYAYQFQVKEATVDSWRTGDKLEIKVYGDDAKSTSLLATLYIQQLNADATNVEGVIVTVDVGSSTFIPDRFDIIVASN